MQLALAALALIVAGALAPITFMLHLVFFMVCLRVFGALVLAFSFSFLLFHLIFFLSLYALLLF